MVGAVEIIRMDKQDIIDGLDVILGRRGEKITQGDLLIVEAAIMALARVPRPEVEPASLLADLERLGDAFADRVEQIAFSMKPPNPYTPQFVQAVQEFDAAVAKLKRLPPQNGST
jgi:hypothetical protein